MLTLIAACQASVLEQGQYGLEIGITREETNKRREKKK
jgi:hypothetical protein